jgi:peptidyl-tRNA hydrolase, PTH2 family
MVLVVRNDLKMGKGKIGAQCGHASVGAYEKALKTNRAIVQRWENSGCAKICLKVESERELMNFRKGASVRGLNYYLVHDAGRTQVRD